jgi:prolyl oligopeptidase
MPTYPGLDIAPRDESVQDDYHGTKITDHYRWLEDPQSEPTKKWIDAQVKVWDQYLNEKSENSINREQAIKDLTEMMNYEKVGIPSKKGKTILFILTSIGRDDHPNDHVAYYFYKNNGLQNQFVLWKKMSLAPNAPEEVFLDPNLLSEDGTSALGSTAFSTDGHHFAYGVSQKGSDWQTIHVKRVVDKQDLEGHVLEYCKFTSLAWTRDSKGFFYTRYPKPNVGDDLGAEVEKNENQKIYYHRLDSKSQDEDELVYETPDHPNWMFGVEVSDDGEYLIISVSESTAEVNQLYWTRLKFKNEEEQSDVVFDDRDGNSIKVVKLVDNFDALYSFVTNTGPLFYFQTNLDAPLKKVICIDVNNPTVRAEILPQHETNPLQFVSAINQVHLVACYTQNVQDEMKLYTLADGKHIQDIPLPTIGSIIGLSGRREDTRMFYKFSSFAYAGTSYEFNFDTMKSTVFYETKTSDAINSPDSFEVKQEWYTSKDGTKVPMFIVHNKISKRTGKPLELDGSNPVWLYGYGGFNIGLKPYFAVSRLFFIQKFDGIFALANIRGGDEFGEEWHAKGVQANKQNGFDDFIGAAEYLINKKYTRPDKLWINGGSNGGLLVAAVINQRPDLFGAAVPQVGVLDMLRFHKFTIGHHWCSDYGCSDKKDNFEYLIKYSPLHTVKDQQYPSVLITTSDHDDRVVPLHSFKFAAELQHTAGAKNKRPLLIRIETKAGHGAGKPLTKVIEETVDTLVFVAKELELTYV